MEKQLVEPFECVTTRLVKNEDLNHHGTLYAGRTAEWVVDSGFVAISSILNPKNIVCLKIHGLFFSQATRTGEVLRFTSRIAYTGKTSIVVQVEAHKNKSKGHALSAFVTFIHVDESTLPAPHFVTLNPITKADKKLFEEASELHKK
ncbi:MAG: hotdog domain-containing protein [Bacteroidota bacterium]